MKSFEVSFGKMIVMVSRCISMDGLSLFKVYHCGILMVKANLVLCLSCGNRCVAWVKRETHKCFIIFCLLDI